MPDDTAQEIDLTAIRFLIFRCPRPHSKATFVSLDGFLVSAFLLQHAREKDINACVLAAFGQYAAQGKDRFGIATVVLSRFARCHRLVALSHP